MVVKTAIVVGVGPGLGAALARKFAGQGFNIALISRSMDKLTPVANELASKQVKTGCYPCNTTDEAQVGQTYDKICAELGVPEVLCYNAGPSGFYPPPPFLDTKLDKFRECLDAAVTGAFIWSQKVIPPMLEAKKGTILLTGATAALRGASQFSLLSTGKFALRSLGQSLAREFHPQGIHVAHVIVDGLIYQPGAEERFGGMAKEKFLDNDAMAEEYWKLYSQHRSTWSTEIDIRPFIEKF